ncbi:MAG: MbnP family protein [Crocinitomicaceae bacterium]
MKTILSLIAVAFIALSADAQVNTELRIYHMLGTQAFQLSATAQNNMGYDFQVDRLQYYISNFSVVHDGGTETTISSDTIALMNAADGSFSTIELGSLNITTVEAVKFHIGVPQPTNNENPGLYGPDHPLAPQSPSMHWGWASGYRFLAYEGKGGMNFSQTFQMHGLGNSNYFQTTVSATGQMINGALVIALDADYVRGVEDINVSNGVIAHGVDQEDLTALENFRDYVFSSSSQDLTASQEELDALNWDIYPNPSAGVIQIDVDDQVQFDRIRVTDALGQEIVVVSPSEGVTTIELNASGVYLVSLENDGQILTTQRIIKQ